MSIRSLAAAVAVSLALCHAVRTRAHPTPAPRRATILYTNDFHSAIDPIPAYWLPGSPKLGGAAQLSSLVNRIREAEPSVFLFDSGDLFTGTFSFLTKGEALM